jgi:hypothetical protein
MCQHLVGWVANPLLWIGLVLLWLGRRGPAAIIGIFSLVAAGGWYVLDAVLGIDGGCVSSVEPEFYVWMSSLVLFTLLGLWAMRQSDYERRSFTSQSVAKGLVYCTFAFVAVLFARIGVQYARGPSVRAYQVIQNGISREDVLKVLGSPDGSDETTTNGKVFSSNDRWTTPSAFISITYDDRGLVSSKSLDEHDSLLAAIFGR